MNLKFLTAAAVLSTALAVPALAQDAHGRSDAIRQTQTHQRVYHHNSGFWPADVAAGVVGGAIGTAGAIATAPFRNDAYAYNDGYYGRHYYGDYNNGFVCGHDLHRRGWPAAHLSVIEQRRAREERRLHGRLSSCPLVRALCPRNSRERLIA